MAELISEQHPAVRARKSRWDVGGGGWEAARKIQGDERELVDPISSPGEVAKAAKSMRSIFQPSRRGAGTRPATLRKLQNPRTVSDPLVRTLWPGKFPPRGERLQQAGRQTVGDPRGPDPTAKFAPKPSWAQRAAKTRGLSAENASTEETGMNKIYERVAELIMDEIKSGSGDLPGRDTTGAVSKPMMRWMTPGEEAEAAHKRFLSRKGPRIVSPHTGDYVRGGMETKADKAKSEREARPGQAGLQTPLTKASRKKALKSVFKAQPHKKK